MSNLYYSEGEHLFRTIPDGDIASPKQIKEYYENKRYKEDKNMGQTCTPNEWDHCRVEKMGCPGCYYDEDDHKAMPSTYQKTRLNELIKGNCAHCNNGKPMYCESCYQKLITENLELQTKIKNMVAPNMSAYIDKADILLFIESLYCIVNSNTENKDLILLKMLSQKLNELGRYEK